jgi:hypothetical protein
LETFGKGKKVMKLGFWISLASVATPFGLTAIPSHTAQAQSPSSPYAAVTEARQLYTLGDFLAASQALEKVLYPRAQLSGGQLEEARKLYGSLRFILNDKKKAESVFTLVLSQNPRSRLESKDGAEPAIVQLFEDVRKKTNPLPQVLAKDVKAPQASAASSDAPFLQSRQQKSQGVPPSTPMAGEETISAAAKPIPPGATQGGAKPLASKPFTLILPLGTGQFVNKQPLLGAGLGATQLVGLGWTYMAFSWQQSIEKKKSEYEASSYKKASQSLTQQQMMGLGLFLGAWGFGAVQAWKTYDSSLLKANQPGAGQKRKWSLSPGLNPQGGVSVSWNYELK